MINIIINIMRIANNCSIILRIIINIIGISDNYFVFKDNNLKLSN